MNPLLLIGLLVTCTFLAYFGFWQLYIHSSSSFSRVTDKRNPAKLGRFYDPKPTNKSINYDSILDEVDGLFTFIQISDIHISRFNPHGGFPHFQSFLENELKIITPDLVVLTGDLVDAKSQQHLSSQQYIDEWVTYQTQLNVSGVLTRNGTFFFDQRGNHDCFNVPNGFNGSEYSRMSATRSEGYVYSHRKPFGTYNFVALDACARAGTSRPFNFFGILENHDMDVLASVLDNATRDRENHTFVATHYPTATLMTGYSKDGRGLVDLGPKVSLWMCGHLHQLVAGLGKVMYGRHARPLDFLELELGDMKDHAVYRIVAVDHDMISFTDEKLSLVTIPSLREHDIINRPNDTHPPPPARKDSQPVILITNPRDARFAIPTREPIDRIRQSEFIRILIYSDTEIQQNNVEVYIDGMKSTRLGGPLLARPYRKRSQFVRPQLGVGNYLPLWTVHWDPSEFDDDMDHTLRVVVKDSRGGMSEKEIVFRVDGEISHTKDLGSGFGGKVILAPFNYLIKISFIGLHILLTGTLLCAKIFVLLLREQGRYEQYRRQLRGSLNALWMTAKPNQSYATNTHDVEDPEIESAFLSPPLRRDETTNEPLLGQTQPRRERRKGLDHKIISKVYALWIVVLEALLDFVDRKDWFYPMYGFLLYILVGPWFIGNLVPSASLMKNRVGMFFTVGIHFFGSKWVPMLDTWFYSLWNLCSLFCPLLLFFLVNLRSNISAPPLFTVQSSHPTPASAAMFHFKVMITAALYAMEKVGMILILAINLNYFNMVPAYGIFSMVLSPGLAWFWIWGASQIVRTWWLGWRLVPREKKVWEEQESGEIERQAAEDSEESGAGAGSSSRRDDSVGSATRRRNRHR